MLEATVTIPDETISRVSLNDASTELLRKLWIQYGPLMFHQSGGCCDGSSPMCYPAGDFLTSDNDVRLGTFDIGPNADGSPMPIDFWMSREQFAYWSHTHLTVDVVKGRGSGFSVEAPEGVRFMIRSRLMDSATPFV
ncbi:MAG: UDP-glucose 4-epimerase [Subtercola sp.]|nr:UDP-glucose 4-epimerase [Subtercola sp.]